jgi:hypothetical protein
MLQLVPLSWLVDNSYVIYLSACTWAVGDAAFNLYPNTMLSLHFMTETEPAFSILKFFQVYLSCSSIKWNHSLTM